MRSFTGKQVLKTFVDNKYEIGELVSLRDDWDHFGIGIVIKVLTTDEIIDIYNESILNLAVGSSGGIYTVCFSTGKVINAFGRELKNAAN